MPGRVLVVRVGAMGDVLHALPAVAALKQRRPEVQVGWAIEPRWRALLENSAGERPVVDAVHLVETGLWKRRPASMATLRSVSALRSELRAMHYEVCVDMQGSVRAGVIGRMAGAGAVVGMAEPREGPARWMYGRRVRVGSRHVVEQGAELLGAAIGEELLPAAVALPREASAELWCEALLAGEGRPVVLLAPRAGWGAKQWPAERFGGLAARLAAEGCAVLVNAAGEDDAVAGAVVRGAGGGRVRAVRASLAELIALTQRMSLVVAGDTGPLHLAATLGVPVVGLYGPTDPARTGPYGEESDLVRACDLERTGTRGRVLEWTGTRRRVLRHASSVTSHRRHEGTEGGLLRIAVGEVAEAALELLRARAGADWRGGRGE